ncbi:hypothetical protein T484DRAFT_1984476 [Baffinella frigidus]|nr:hypothetical protein T484DRAFT_1984476 [Cryptophyta sp. CCMP2293]
MRSAACTLRGTACVPALSAMLLPRECSAFHMYVHAADGLPSYLPPPPSLHLPPSLPPSPPPLPPITPSTPRSPPYIHPPLGVAVRGPP